MALQLKFFIMSEGFLNEKYKFSPGEMKNQGKALADLMGSKRTVLLEIILIKLYGSEFRQIIEEFKEKFKKVPSPDDLIWIAGVHAKKDPHVIVDRIARTLEKKNKKDKGKK